jgi:aryl-alcohol dehydrogenase-like predicted oxidoreductase
MGLSAFYGNRVSDEESHEVIKAAVDEGCTLIDTANVSRPLLDVCTPK